MNMHKCIETKTKYMVLNSEGGHTCTGCGYMTENIRFVPEYDSNAWRKKKSQHKRNKWFAKRLFGVVDYKFIDILVWDFIQVVGQLVEKGLVRRNISKYGYYIIRLANRRGIPLKSHVNDIKPGKTQVTFDRNFFGVYKDLGWKKCSYYREWLKMQEFQVR